MQALLSALIFSAMMTDVTSLLRLDGEQVQKVTSALSHEDKFNLLQKLHENGVVRRMADAQIKGLHAGVGSVAILNATMRWLDAHPTYEFTLRKHERVNDEVNKVPDRIFVRYREKPLAVYARWLEGGRHTGQEVLYDSRRNPTQMLAHAGGILGLVTVNLSIDSSFARNESNHSITELGFRRIIKGLIDDRNQMVAAGMPVEPVEAKGTVLDGKRYWETLFVNPGPPKFYSARARLFFDLDTGMPRVIEVSSKEGVLLERYHYEEVNWAPIDDRAFDEENPEYRF